MLRRSTWFGMWRGRVGGLLASVVLISLGRVWADETNKVFVGYLFRKPAVIHYELYTHLCHAFLTADGEGNIRTNRDLPSRDLTASAHAKGVKVLLSVGGWGWDQQFASIVRQPEAEERYARSVLQIVEDYGYDGIDFDWEYPDTPEEVAGFGRLSRRFRAELDAIGARKQRKMFLTMAASATPGTLKWLPTELLLGTMDWLNVMTYDMAGGWSDHANHHSPLFASSKAQGEPRSTEISMKYLLARGLPPNRLAVGIPLYGRGFAVAEPYASTRNGDGRRPPRAGDYANLAKLQQESGWIRWWDDETKNPWLLAPDHSGVICYDDPESAALKTQWAVNQGFRGVFFWHIGADLLPDGRNPIQEICREKWNADSQ